MNSAISQNIDNKHIYDEKEIQLILDNKNDDELLNLSRQIANDVVQLKIQSKPYLVLIYTFLSTKNEDTLIKAKLLGKATIVINEIPIDQLDDSSNIKLIKEILTKYGELNLQDPQYKNIRMERAKFVDDYLSHLINTIKISNDVKLDMVVSGFEFFRNKESFNFLSYFAQKSEPILFLDTSNQALSDRRLLTIAEMQARSITSPFQRGRDEVIEYLNNQLKQSTSVIIKYALPLVIGKYYNNIGNYALAESYFQMSIKAIPADIPKSNARLTALLPKLQILKTLRDSGDLARLNVEYKKIKIEMNWLFQEYLNNVESKKVKQTTLKNLFSILSIVMDIQNFLGEYRDSIEFGNLLLSNIGSNDGDILISQYQASIYKNLSIDYKKMGDSDNYKKYRILAFQKNLTSSIIDQEELALEILEELGKRDFLTAQNNINLLKNSISKAKLLPIDKDISLSFLEATEQLKIELEDNKDEKMAFQKFCSKAALASQMGLYSNQFMGRPIQLSLINQAYTFNKCAGDKVYAGYFAKLYINQLQDLRQNLLDDKSSLVTFTQSYEDQLKDFANNFYDIGDTESALLTFRILKENKFLDFLRTRSSNELDKYRLRLPTNLEEVSAKLLSATSELAALEKLIQNSDNKSDSSNYKLLIKGIELKKQQISEYSNLLKNKIHSQESLQVKANDQPFKIPLLDTEALIDFALLKDSLTIYLTTNKGTSSFNKEINRDELIQLLNIVSSDLASNKKIHANDLNNLSNTLFIREILNLKNQHITTLKIRSDELIGMIPLAILSSNNHSLGEQFFIEMQGLGRSKYDDHAKKSIYVFGTTKKYSGFDELPNVREETKYISNLRSEGQSNTNYSLSLDEDFNRGNFFSSFKSGKKIIHISTHYKALSANNSSGVLLLGDGSLLSVEDIRNNLEKINPVNLVTLSACDTGLVLSKNESSSNLEGLSNLFNVKGAALVMGTLWSVADESTADFMRLFYILTLKDNIPPLESLQQTQLAFKTGSLNALQSKSLLPNDDFIKGLGNRIANYRSPFFWAPFQITGS